MIKSFNFLKQNYSNHLQAVEGIEEVVSEEMTTGRDTSGTDTNGTDLEMGTAVIIINSMIATTVTMIY